MYLNPVSYAHGLLDELEGALRAGRDEVVASIRKELAALRKNQLQFSEQEVKDMSDDAKIAVASLRERLAAYDGGAKAATPARDSSADEKTAEEPADAETAPEKASGKGPARTAKAAAAPEAAVKPPAK